MKNIDFSLILAVLLSPIAAVACLEFIKKIRTSNKATTFAIAVALAFFTILACFFMSGSILIDAFTSGSLSAVFASAAFAAFAFTFVLAVVRNIKATKVFLFLSFLFMSITVFLNGGYLAGIGISVIAVASYLIFLEREAVLKA